MTTTTTEAPADAPASDVRFLRLPQVLARIPIGRTAWYQAIKDGDAPAPVKLGTVSMWPAHEIDALAARLMGARKA